MSLVIDVIHIAILKQYEIYATLSKNIERYNQYTVNSLTIYRNIRLLRKNIYFR